MLLRVSRVVCSFVSCESVGDGEDATGSFLGAVCSCGGAGSASGGTPPPGRDGGGATCTGDACFSSRRLRASRISMTAVDDCRFQIKCAMSVARRRVPHTTSPESDAGGGALVCSVVCCCCCCCGNESSSPSPCFQLLLLSCKGSRSFIPLASTTLAGTRRFETVAKSTQQQGRRRRERDSGDETCARERSQGTTRGTVCRLFYWYQ